MRNVLPAALLAVTIGALGSCSVVLSAPTPAAAITPLSISVVGNHLVNGEDRTIRLLGVDVPGTEYACEEGWGYSSVPITQASADAIAAWDANAVRVPLNEDCWLGLSGQPSFGTQAGYRQAIEDWVTDLNDAGLYVILDLHWSAPGSNVADGQRPMPDDHSVAFWTSVATTFKSDPAVVFDAFNEPYSPAADGVSTLAVGWTCWKNGGCTLPVTKDGTTARHSPTYTAVGMQALVTAIRETGAAQPIMLGGLSYANDLSTWLADEPSDPDDALVASFHNYYGGACDSTACWSSVIAPIAARVPVVTGEFDQGYDCVDPPSGPSSLTTFDDTYMDWADAHGVSYLAWGWYVLGTSTAACSALGGAGGDAFSLVSNTALGTPVAPDGANLRAHLEALAAGSTAPVTSTPPATTTTTLASSLPNGSGYGQPVTFTAGVDVEETAAADGSVVFTVNGSPLGPPVPVADGVATVVTNGSSLLLPSGDDSIGATFTGAAGSDQASSSDHVMQDVAPPPSAPPNPGYDLVGADGGVFVFSANGSGGFYGSLPGLGVGVEDIVGIVPSSDAHGYFLVGSDGGVFSFGATTFEGSLPGIHVTVDDIVGIVPTADDRGYVLVGRDGGVFAFGDARFLGSLPGNGVRVDDVVGIASAAGGTGYWVVEANGTATAFGTAASYGNAAVTGSPVAGIAGTPEGTGYWVVTADGGVQSYGSATYHGSLPALGVTPALPVVSLVPTPGGGGYWLFGSDGGVFAFGDATDLGSLPGLGISVSDVVGAVPTSS